MNEKYYEEIIKNNVNKLIDKLEKEKVDYSLCDLAIFTLKQYKEEKILFPGLVNFLRHLLCLGCIDKDYKSECDRYNPFFCCESCWANYLRRGVE